MRNLLLIGLVIVTAHTALPEKAEAGKLFFRSRCSGQRIRIFRPRCPRVVFTQCCNASRTTVIQSTPSTTTVPDNGPAAPDTTTNQQVPEIAPAPPIGQSGVTDGSSGPPAPAVQSSEPEAATTTTPPPAPTLEEPKPTNPPFQLLDPNRRRTPRAPTTPYVTPTTEDVAPPTPIEDFNLLGSANQNFYLLGTGGSPSTGSSPFLLVRSP